MQGVNKKEEYNILKKIKIPGDVKNLNANELILLCGEIRDKIIKTISKTGGHIASSLGVVELTVAIYKIFDFPQDKLIWDVGHQSYAHKLLTCRFDKFDTIRQKNGLTGFTRRSESIYDSFISGHSSTSISVACGFCKSGEILHNDYYTIAVIGDGSLTGGLAYEGMNNVKKNGREKLIVILNDNNMSIAKNVGAISKYLSKIRSTPGYFKFKDNLKNNLSKIPFVGTKINNTLVKSKMLVKESIYHSNMFENFGFEYLGPVDGHDLSRLISVLSRAKDLSKPVFVHVKTVKGKGYKLAEKNPSMYHGISSKQNKPEAEQIKTDFKDFSAVFGDELIKIASKDEKIVAVTAAMKHGTGLLEFSKKFPKNFFDVGIAEQHAVTFAAGLAASGCMPVVAIYSSFLQRSLDQIIHDLAIEKQHIVLAVDRAGVVGEDGETHQGIFDVSFLSMIPGVTILSPATYKELRKNLNKALYHYEGVVAVRYPRGSEINLNNKYNIDDGSYSEYNFWQEKNYDVLLVTYGRLFGIICNFKENLQGENKNKISILKLNKIWPLEDEIISIIKNFKKVIFVEESIKSGGIAEHLAGKLLEQKFKGDYLIKAIDNQFVSQATVEQSLNDLGFNFNSLSELIF